jgi:hypothetical protein
MIAISAAASAALEREMDHVIAVARRLPDGDFKDGLVLSAQICGVAAAGLALADEEPFPVF